MNTVEFLGTWEKVFNPEFNSAEFDIIKSKAGLNNFRLSAKEWTEKTHAIGIVSKAGRYGGTYAHKDIAFEFAMWISPELKGNIRDYATINQLICLSNMESLNAILINDGLPQPERLRRLNAIAIQQMSVLEGEESNRKLLK